MSRLDPYVPSIRHGSPREEFRSKLEAIVSAWEIDHSQVAAWKLGGSTHSVSKELGAITPVFGPLMVSQVTSQPAKVIAASANCFEVEVAMRCTDKYGFEWCWALDLPSKVAFSSTRPKWESLVQAHGGAGHLVLFDNSARRDLSDLPECASVSIRGNEFEIEFSRMVRPFLDTYADFHAWARQVGVSPRLDHWVALGGLTPCIKVSGSERITLCSQGETVVTIEISADSSSA